MKPGAMDAWAPYFDSCGDWPHHWVDVADLDVAESRVLSYNKDVRAIDAYYWRPFDLGTSFVVGRLRDGTYFCLIEQKNLLRAVQRRMIIAVDRDLFLAAIPKDVRDAIKGKLCAKGVGLHRRWARVRRMPPKTNHGGE